MKMFLRSAAIVAVVVSLCSLSAAQGAGGCYGKDCEVLQAGVGFGLYAGGYGNLTVPPISGTFDYGATDLVSLGIGIGFQGSSYTLFDGNNGQWKWSYASVPVMARAAFHPFHLDAIKQSIPSRDKWDVYGGLSLGYAITGYHETVAGEAGGTPLYAPGSSYPQLGLLLGTRWYLNPKFAVYFEEGSGFGWVTIGGCWKI